jgi:serine/threonine protein kinase
MPLGFGEEHTQVGIEVVPVPFEANVSRSRAYSFVLDPEGLPVELGSGRFAKAYLGEERWLESKTAFTRPVAIKVLQRGVSEEDAMRFQMEKELLERVQGHPNIIHLYASGEGDNPEFIPRSIRDKVENDYMILELMEMSLEERLKGSRNNGQRDDLLAYPFRERLFRVLEYMVPIASAIEYAHLVRNICHRDIKPANVLLRLPDPRLASATMDVRLADFNVGKVREEKQDLSVTRFHGVPGTLFFQSPEQETNSLELLVNVEQGSAEVDYFEDFYMPIAKNDFFQIFNRSERYPVVGADRVKNKLLLGVPFRQRSERNVRAKIIKSVDRPADIYSLGATFYYLVSGAYANPKSLYESFHKFIEYERDDEQNTVESYIEHEYEVINSLRTPKKDHDKPLVAPADRFFTYKHYLDGNGELIDARVMRILARAMIRNKPDSYCQAWDVETTGISDFVGDLLQLYAEFGVDASVRAALGHVTHATRPNFFVRTWNRLFRGRRRSRALKPLRRTQSQQTLQPPQSPSP